MDVPKSPHLYSTLRPINLNCRRAHNFVALQVVVRVHLSELYSTKYVQFHGTPPGKNRRHTPSAGHSLRLVRYSMRSVRSVKVVSYLSCRSEPVSEFKVSRIVQRCFSGFRGTLVLVIDDVYLGKFLDALIPRPKFRAVPTYWELIIDLLIGCNPDASGTGRANLPIVLAYAGLNRRL